MSVLAANFQLIYQGKQQPQKLSGGRRLLLEKPHVYGYGVSNQQWVIGKRGSRGVRQAAAFWEDTSRGGNVVDLEEIKDCEQLDQILLQAKDYSQPILIDWMAAWCRKCIFLKPKLEKLAAEYGTKLRFYCVDVNSVPQALVKRGNISKMPTIQLWKDGELKAEVIGGHKAWLVVDEVREMIQKFV